jgi:HEAT repeat protein
MRELIQLNSEQFRRSALTLLRGDFDRRGCRYLLTLLWTHDLLLPILSDARIPLDRALAAAHVAAEIDPQLHIRITRYLISTTLDQQTIDENEATRLLQILGTINDSVSLQPFVRQMLLHPSARIRSKLSLLIGRSQAGNKSLATLLSDPDARVRANAVEALWHNDNPQIAVLVRAALEDSNNRVVGNAILGLYFAGDPLSIPAAISLVSHVEPLFRATAAWAMGETGDPRFLACLGRMLAGSVGQIRKAVFRAIGLIKKAAAVRAAAAPLCVSVLDVGTSPKGAIRVKAVVGAANAAGISPMAEIPSTAFVIETNGALVTDYTCSISATERISLALAIPRSGDLTQEDLLFIECAIQSSVRAKRPSDQWALARYSKEETKQANSATLLGQNLDLASDWAGDPVDAPVPKKPSYTANPAVLIREAESRSKRFETDPGLLATLRLLIATSPAGSGARHLVVVIPTPEFIEEEALDDLIQLAAAYRVSVHVLCLYPAPDYFELCHATRGFYREMAGFDEFPRDLEILCAGAAKHYQLDFMPTAGIEEFSIDVNLPSAAGCAHWRRPDFVGESNVGESNADESNKHESDCDEVASSD